MDLLANTPTKTADPSAIFGTLGLPALLFPCQIVTESPPVTGYNNDLWTKAGSLGPRPIRPVYSFPLEFPPGCLERLMVRLNWPEEFQFIYTEIWKTGVQMHHVTHQILIRFGSEFSKDGPTIVRFEVRALPSVEEPVLRVPDARVSPGVAESIDGLNVQCAESENLPEPISMSAIKSTSKRRRQRVRWHRWPVPEETVWALLTPILRELEGVLLAYPGLYYNRFLQCPKCNELSFTGEWFAPQDAQSVRYRRCAVCAYKLSTRLLAPPERGQMRMKSTEPHRR